MAIACIRCSRDNPEEANFCSHCGAPLRLNCASCGHVNPPQARFCNACGTSLQSAPGATPAAPDPAPAAEPAPADRARPARTDANPKSYTPDHLARRILNNRSAIEGERKQVTVLFADLKGSLELSEQVDAEEWHEVLDRFFAILTDAVHQFEGTINQYTGDGIMALFGAPIAHEDHAVRACHAALAMRQELRKFADELRMQHGLNLSARIGLNSGEVVVGKIGDDLRMDYTAQGHTVGLAARMEAICEPGRAFLTRNTATLVEGYFRLRDLGETRVKGVSDLVRVYELEGVGESTLRIELSRARGLSTFIGRDAEIAQLRASLEEVLAGATRAVAVVADGGIGKSRLCYEFITECRRKGLTVHATSGVPYGAAVPNFPILALFRSVFGVTEADAPEEARRKVAGTMALVGFENKDALPLVLEFMGIAEPGRLRPDVPPEQREEILTEVFRRICLACSNGPVVMLIEDMHWIDPASENFLRRAFQGRLDHPLLVIINYRPGYANTCLGKRISREIRLQPLGDEAIGQLAREQLGDSECTVKLARRIRKQAAGNPFFVEEAVRSLVERGYLAGTRGDYRLKKEVDRLGIPPTVEAIIAARIDRLTDTQKQALQTAAVIGQEFTQEMLSSICDLGGEDLADALHVLQDGNYIYELQLEPEREFGFAHPLTQQVAYKSQLRDRRARIHARMANWLESRVPDQEVPGETCALLAHHWAHAREPVRAAHWTNLAAVWSSQRFLDEALAHYRQSIALLEKAPQTPEAVHLGIVARAGIVRTAPMYHVPEEEVERSCTEARRMAEEHNDRLGLAELLIANSGESLHRGDAELSLQQVLEAQAIADEMGDRGLIARFRIPILLSYFATGRLREGLQAIQGDWAEGEMTLENLASRAFRALMLAYTGKLDEGEKEMRQALRIAASAGRNISWIHANLVDIAYLSGRYDNARSEAQLAVAKAEEYGSPFFMAVAYRALGSVHAIHREWPQAMEVLESSLPLTDRGKPGFQFRPQHLIHLAAARFGCGMPEAAIETIDEAIDLSRRGSFRLTHCDALLCKARILRKWRCREATDEVFAMLEEAEALIGWTGADIYTPFAQLERAKLAAALKDKAARRFADAARALFLEVGAQGHARRVNDVLGGEAAVSGGAA